MSKFLLIFAWFIAAFSQGFSQTPEVHSRAYILAAQQKYEVKSYDLCLEFLNEAEKILGIKTSDISALRTKAYFAKKDFTYADFACKEFYLITPKDSLIYYPEMTLLTQKIVAELKFEREAILKSLLNQNIKGEDFCEKLKKYVDENVKIDMTDENAVSAFMWACYECDLATVQAMVEKGADPKVRGIIYYNLPTDSSYFGSPLVAAAGQGKFEVVKYLYENGVNVNEKELSVKPGQGGWNALMSASYYGQPTIAGFLLKNGADVNTKTSDGWSALTYAAFRGNYSMIELLIKYGADINSLTVIGNSPLMLASQKSHLDVVELLLKHGANPSFKNAFNETAITIAKSFEMKSLIRKYKAK